MVLSDVERRVVAAIQDGLPLCHRPYAEIGRRLGLDEQTVIDTVARLQAAGHIKRMGIVVRHHELGYTANAMVVWDIPDEVVDEVGRRLGEAECVTLCYRRPRRLPLWRYNLFSMIHGRDEASVRRRIDELARELGLTAYPREVLFSGRRFRQRGARYVYGSGR